MSALTRSQLVAELSARHGDALRAVGIAVADTTGSLKEPVDDALRAIGVAFGGLASATVDDAELDRFLAIAAVRVLERALAGTTGMADVAATGLGVSKRRNQIVGNVQAQLNQARAVAARFGYRTTTRTMASGVFDLGTTETDGEA